MAVIRVRTGGTELEVADEAALERLRREGRLAPDAERWANGAWRPLAAAASTGVPDPWAAWSDVDDHAAEALLANLTQRADDEPAELPLAALEPMPRAIVVQPRRVDGRPATMAGAATAKGAGSVVTEARPAAAATPTAATPTAATPSVAPATTPPAAATAAAPAAATAAPPAPAAPPAAAAPPAPPRPPPPANLRELVPPAAPRDPPSLPPDLVRPRTSGPPTPIDAGQLIDFPRRPSRPAPPSLPPLPSPRESGPPPIVRPTRLLAMIGAGVFVLGGLWAVEAMTHPVIPPVVSVGAHDEPAADDPLAATEKALRAVGLGAPHPVRKPADFGDAALVELQQLGLSVNSVDAPVTRWTGRKGDDPAAAELHVRFRPSADLNHDLGAILLVAGRYKLRYDLDMPVIEAIAEDESGARGTTLDATRAESFAKGRIGLGAALGLR